MSARERVQVVHQRVGLESGRVVGGRDGGLGAGGSEGSGGSQHRWGGIVQQLHRGPNGRADLKAF